ncbi:MAG: hypothetical protein M0Q54_12165 [Pigmentiphaga sp.]|nr:hypothetical protein [Pigmentiphaga sp.]
MHDGLPRYLHQPGAKKAARFAGGFFGVGILLITALPFLRQRHWKNQKSKNRSGKKRYSFFHYISRYAPSQAPIGGRISKKRKTGLRTTLDPGARRQGFQRSRTVRLK